MRRTSGERHTFVCAWCNVLLRSSPDPKCTTVNYGICPQCLESQLRALTLVSGTRSANGRKPGSGRGRKRTAEGLESFADALRG
jgi:hypothetical protein